MKSFVLQLALALFSVCSLAGADSSALSPADQVTIERGKEFLLRRRQFLYEDAAVRNACGKGEKSPTECRSYLSSKFIPKNLGQIREVDGILQTAKLPEARAILLRNREEMVRADTEARSELAASKSSQKMPEPPEEAERLIKAVATFQNEFTPTFRNLTEKHASCTQVEPKFKNLINLFMPLKPYLMQRKKSVAGDSKYSKLIDDEIRVVDLVVEALQSTIQYCSSKDNRELDIVAKNLQAAGEIVKNFEYPDSPSRRRSVTSVKK